MNWRNILLRYLLHTLFCILFIQLYISICTNLCSFFFFSYLLQRNLPEYIQFYHVINKQTWKTWQVSGPIFEKFHSVWSCKTFYGCIHYCYMGKPGFPQDGCNIFSKEKICKSQSQSQGTVTFNSGSTDCIPLYDIFFCIIPRKCLDVVMYFVQST